MLGASAAIDKVTDAPFVSSEHVTHVNKKPRAPSLSLQTTAWETPQQ